MPAPRSPCPGVARAGPSAGTYFRGYSALVYLVIELLPTGSLSGHSPASIATVLEYRSASPPRPTCRRWLRSSRAGLGVGPAIAFFATGAGTSIGAITGAFVIARVTALVVALLFTGALALGTLTVAILLSKRAGQPCGLRT